MLSSWSYASLLFFSLTCCCEWLSGTIAVGFTGGPTENYKKNSLFQECIHTYMYKCVAYSIFMHCIDVSYCCLLTSETVQFSEEKSCRLARGRDLVVAGDTP